MLPYYLLIFFPYFIEWIETILRPHENRVSLVNHSNLSIKVFFVIWFVMLSLRHSVKCGWDLPQYQYFFNSTANLNFFDIFKAYKTEQLYFVLNWGLAHIYPDFRFFLVVMAFLCTGTVGWFYYKKTEYPLLTILLFVTNSCFIMFYSGLRQSLAMLLVVPAYYFTIQKRIIPFVLIVIVAKFFHNSALILIFLYPVFHIPLRSKHFLFIMALVAMFFLLNTYLFTFVVPFLSEKYSTAFIEETGAYSVWIMFLLFLVYSFVVLDDSKMNSECLGLRNILVLMTLIQGFAPIHPLAMRMNYYFILIFPIIIPKLMLYPKFGNEDIAQLSRWGMVLFFTFYFFYLIHSGRAGLGAFPYVALWE